MSFNKGKTEQVGKLKGKAAEAPEAAVLALSLANEAATPQQRGELAEIANALPGAQAQTREELIRRLQTFIAREA